MSSRDPSSIPSDSRYEIGPVIGRGGNATVFEAYDHEQGRRVALKVGAMDEGASARLEREGRAASAIHHPNVCRTLDYGTLDDGHPYVAMELLEGETLRAYLQRRGRLDAEEAIEIGVQLLAGVEAAHELCVVHRDIKPENVFIGRSATGEMRIKLLDFGVCRRGLHPLDERTLTLAGCVVGTPGYLAPEQAYGERVLDHRVDIFAVGLVLFEALTGRPAYESHNTTELSAALARPLRPIRSLAPVPRALELVIQAATEPEARMRYATVARFLHDLLEARTSMRREARARLHEEVEPVAPASTGERAIFKEAAPTRQVRTRTRARVATAAAPPAIFRGFVVGYDR